ncbi:fumarylacetoacetate hydrolase family protein [Aquabacter sp. CN5-332]|uniref:fumarylacetoacetate hydrolase family protein n=1 Tax=Aquabacter sp. CN5-332 TaxID=3156608 RepID=UPI0032B3B9E6
MAPFVRGEAILKAVLSLPSEGTFVGRVWLPEAGGPGIVLVENGTIYDITCPAAPTMADLLEMDDCVGFVRAAEKRKLGSVDAVAADTIAGNHGALHFLAPCDLQAVKASGVTFAQSILERVIEEKAAGDPALAVAFRARIEASIGGGLRDLVPGSPEAMALKQTLIEEGLWSQYLEVGIGPDAEVFTKSQPMSCVGWGAAVGIHPASHWNNPEPELVLFVNSRGDIKGASLGNDVNLRDIEGRSALLLGKAKDNNASCAVGPLVRLLDESYGLDDIRRSEVELRVEGSDGFVLEGQSSMSEISRDPTDLVSQAINRNHQYPDGFILFLGTLFTPVQDRGEAGQGFTHHRGDVVAISNHHLGRLVNIVLPSDECPKWSFGVRALMKNLSGRKLL